MKITIDLNNYKSLADVPEAQELFEKYNVLCGCIKVDRFNCEREALRKPQPADPNPLMAVLSADGKMEIMSRKCCRKKFGAVAWLEEFDSVAQAGEYSLPVIFRSTDVISIGENDYVAGPVVAYRSDENGNEASVNGLMLAAAYRYLKDNTVTLCIGGDAYKAFKL